MSFSPAPPSIVIPPGNVGIEIEKNGSLQCEAIGIPPPKIIWRRGDGKPLDSTGRFQQLPSGGLAISSKRLVVLSNTVMFQFYNNHL